MKDAKPIPLIRPLTPNVRGGTHLYLGAVNSGILSNYGPVHEQLRSKLQDIAGGHVVPVTSGTAAIEVALAVSGLEPGDRVMIPDFTHSGTLLAIVRAGLVPVLAGVDPKTWCLRPEEAEQAIRDSKIDGVIVVSPFGYEVDIVAWEAVQDRSGFTLLFDFAGAFGHFPRTNAPVCYSFHPTKNFGVSEGGMILFRSERQAKAARRIANFDTLPNREIASTRGGNFKLDELRSAFLLASLEARQLRDVELRIDQKRETLDYYRKNIPGAFVPDGKKYPSLCVLGNLPAGALEHASETLGITFKRYYPLLSSMPCLAEVPRLSTSSEVMKNCCALPSDVTLDEADRVVDIVKSFL